MFHLSIKWMLLICVLAVSTSCEGSTKFDDFERKLEALQRDQKLQRAEDAERIRQLETIVSSQERSIALANQRITDFENKLGELQTQNRRQIDNLDGRAAFSAYLDHDLDGLTNLETIVFNRPLYNSGNDYDPSTGVFTAPVDGVYLFIYFIGNRHAREVDATLVLNGIKQNEAVAEGVQGAHDTQGGNAAILQLTSSDRVWLETTLGDHVEGQWRFSSFTGALLYLN